MGNGSGITGMILSIIGVVLALILIISNLIMRMMELIYGPYLNFLVYFTNLFILAPILPCIGTILSIIGIAKNDNKAPGIIGLTFGLIGVVLSIIGIFLDSSIQSMMMMAIS